MPIPFKNQVEGEQAATAGHLRFLRQSEGDIWLGALFVMDERGEPVEFTHSRMRAPKALLWRPDDARSYCVRTMCASMFDVCPVTPTLILCMAEEVGPDVFTRDLLLDIPVGRVSCSEDASAPQVDWTTPLGDRSPARRLFDLLSARGLLIEPFGRAETGLYEVYSGTPG